MNGNSINNNLMCNQNQISKNLPLKKRRAYMIDNLTSNNEQNEYQPTIAKQAYIKEDPLQIYIPAPPIAPTPPSSPHVELLRQQYAYLLVNPTDVMKQKYFHPSAYDSMIAQQYLDNYRTLVEQQQHHLRSYGVAEDQPKQTDMIIDEHFRKSLENNYNKFTGRCLTPDDSSSNSSPIERTPVDSIEEHFARSLAKFRPSQNALSNDDRISSINHQLTESVVDDHFAKALGSTTWQRLKEKL
ncbi:unnamed protein product [Rotaria socialis]|uniref:Uncharacterized protein n=2 Tax=Rotaria socialis TaxID=392032 RepID=A0A820I283_9BILA|nr:unnamed protein product [Rotaria socialis]CAF3417124.1 unnamed protein product [Rotaria socialis]CAF4305363.1 unnamed protein product [Rotaria socialis]